ncbi:hypothetical protein AJ78_03986 [Emergomyces pasteurianus Ep9510]|uniref:Calcineurin-like phosphoesterase domain-containing protein n=1 Tax=Emergomyces pasteurianus Ep9510 TaxID=1447872 RepID=A0A1J9PIG1_9EURO|nr:hypothetical protein AJ78_03986 [Emergomyces pasteurianus Ep9510]
MALTKLLSRPRRRVRFQVMSDLHLEIIQQYSKFQIKPRAMRLILAGDIGRLADYEAFRDFLGTQCGQFVAVYLVLGNHEFFGVSRQEGLRRADNLQSEPVMNGRLVIMNQKRVDIQDITLLGCTLHSRILPEAEEIVGRKINDFRQIVDWTVANHNLEHLNDVKWLRNEITAIRSTEAGLKQKIVVISHHAPSTKGTSSPSNEGNPWSSAFGTDLLLSEENSCFNDVQWWIYGHTHHSAQSVSGEVRLISNQRGYVFPQPDHDEPGSSAGFMSQLRKFWANDKSLQVLFDPEKIIDV